MNSDVIDAARVADAVLKSRRERVRGLILAEGYVEGKVTFSTQAEFDAFASGLYRGSDLYGAGSCSLYTLKDLDDPSLGDREKRLIREHLGGEGAR